MIEWKNLDSMSQLDQITEDSFNAPQIIFKHSTTCPISGMAKRRLEGDWNLDTNPYYLDLLAYRPISNEIADKYVVVHQSPQVIVIKDGKAIYDESHLDISVDALTKGMGNQVNG